MWVWVNAQAANDLGYEAGQASPVPTWEPCQATPFGQSLLCVVDAYPSNQQTHIPSYTSSRSLHTRFGYSEQ